MFFCLRPQSAPKPRLLRERLLDRPQDGAGLSGVPFGAVRHLHAAVFGDLGGKVGHRSVKAAVILVALQVAQLRGERSQPARKVDDVDRGRIGVPELPRQLPDVVVLRDPLAVERDRVPERPDQLFLVLRLFLQPPDLAVLVFQLRFKLRQPAGIFLHLFF